MAEAYEHTYDYVLDLLEKQDRHIRTCKDSPCIFYFVYNIETYYVLDILDTEESADCIASDLCEIYGEDIYSYIPVDVSSHIKTTVELQRDPKKALNNLMKQINLLKRGKIK